MNALAHAPTNPNHDAARLDPELAPAVLSHLAAQIGSAERLLQIVLQQGAAIRAKNVHEVVRLAGLMHGELTRRQELEEERGHLLNEAGAKLGLAPGAVTVSALCALMDPQSAARVTKRSAELRGLVHELQREHLVNRALMKLELSFLDHLMKTLSLEAGPGYDSTGVSGSGNGRQAAPGAHHVLDLEA